jgi:hypothetical protein
MSHKVNQVTPLFMEIPRQQLDCKAPVESLAGFVHSLPAGGSNLQAADTRHDEQ